MGGNEKWRALRLEVGNFSWGSENTTRKVRLMDVVYNASNNELVRTKTLVKNAIIQIDALPFKQWYATHYGIELAKKKTGAKKDTSSDPDRKKSGHVKAKLEPAWERKSWSRQSRSSSTVVDYWHA